MPINPILVGAAGTAIANWFQNRSFVAQSEAQQRNAEYNAAQSFFATLTKAMGARLYLMRRAFWAITAKEKNEAEIASRWQAYQVVLVDWNSSLSLNDAYLTNYFGSATAERFFDEIQKGFIGLHSSLQKLHEGTQKTASKWDETAVQLGHTITEFDKDLLLMLQRQEVGVFHPEHAHHRK